MTTSEELTRIGTRKLAEFLSEMLRIGWKQSQLDELEKLWLRGHDRNGNLTRLDSKERT